MNILPKKNWHVRTKKNIERVRRDEAKAADEAKELDRRMRLAEQEARTTLLREKAKQKMIESGVDPFSIEPTEDQPVTESGIIATSGHVNFFQQLENGEGGDVRTNKEHEELKKKEQEEYEKKVGYLTYLGQDTEELTGEQVWWKKLPKNRKDNTEENLTKVSVGEKQKDFLDPLCDLKKYLKCDGARLTYQKYEKKNDETDIKSLSLLSSKTKRKKRKRSRSRERSRNRSNDQKKKSRKHSSSSEEKKKKKRKSHLKKKRRRKSSGSSNSAESEDEVKLKAKANLEKMRKERLERERVEREKADRLLYGEPVKEKSSQEELQSKAQKYSSQFNPQIARQNKLDPNKKYWLE